jgi:threonine dehydratase
LPDGEPIVPASALAVKPKDKVCLVLTGGNWDLCDLAEIYK